MEKENKQKLQITRRMAFSKLTNRTKFVFLCIKYAQFVEGYKNGATDKATITTEYLYKRFGIHSNTTIDAVEKLAKYGHIRVKNGYKRSNEGYIIQTTKKAEQYEMIDNILLVTPCMTTEQKIFIMLFYFIIHSDHKKQIYATTKNQKEIIKEMEKFGISASVTKRRIKELTKGNIPVIRKEKRGYSIKLDVVNAMYQLNSIEWEQAFLEASKTKIPIEAPIYNKKNAKYYKWDEAKKRIIKICSDNK